jgi:toxin-antitoxin system PIN domain toxin
LIIPDINLLLYAEIDAFAHHAQARQWFEAVMNGARQVGFAPVCIFGFIRLSTNRRVLTEPLPVDDAINRVDRWLERSNATLLVPGSRHLETSFRLLRSLGTGGNLSTDAQIAAYAIEYGGEIFSNDTDFARFEGVRWVNPLRD